MGKTDKSKKPNAKPTQEELDAERLREIESRIKELTQLISEGTNRTGADQKLQSARDQHDEHRGNKKERAYYRGANTGGGKPIPLSQHTRTHLELADALRLRIRLGGYAAELTDSLERLAEEQVEILERELKRARY